LEGIDMAETKCIRLGKKDAILAKWRKLVLKKGDRLQSLIIKKAILYYLKTGRYLEIGKIYFDPQNIEPVGATINVWLDDEPELLEWVKKMETQKVKITKVFKEILHNCITIVPDEKEEFIHGYYDILLELNNVANVARNNESYKPPEETRYSPIKEQKPKNIDKNNNPINILGLNVRS